MKLASTNGILVGNRVVLEPVGVNDSDRINAVLDSGRHVQLAGGTWHINTPLVYAPGLSIVGCGPMTVLDISDVPAVENAVQMAEGCAIRDLKIVGDISELEIEGRGLEVADHCEVCGIWMSHNNYGVQMAGLRDVSVSNVRFDNIRGVNGWAACLHVTGASAGNIRIDGVHIEDCDRGIEVEDGARNVFASNGYAKGVKSATQASFVLNAHTHNGLGAVENVRFSNFYIEDCDTPLLCYGINETDYMSSVSFEGITLKDCHTYGSDPLMGVAFGEHVEFSGIRSTGCADQKVLAVGNGCRNVLFEYLHVENDGQIVPTLAGQSITIRDAYLREMTGATNAVVIGGSGTGDNILLSRITVDQIVSTYGLRLSGMSNVKLEDVRIIDGGSGLVIGLYCLSDVENLIVQDGAIEGPLSIRTAQDGGRIAGVRVSNGIDLQTESSGVVVEGNTLLAGSITDAGTGNYVRDNP